MVAQNVRTGAIKGRIGSSRYRKSLLKKIVKTFNDDLHDSCNKCPLSFFAAYLCIYIYEYIDSPRAYRIFYNFLGYNDEIKKSTKNTQEQLRNVDHL